MTKNTYLKVLGSIAIIGSVTAAGVALAPHGLQYYGPIIASILIATLTPITIISIRRHVRLSRLRLIDCFDATFRLQNNTSFKSVRSKYLRGLALPHSDLSAVHRQQPVYSRQDWLLLLYALPFIMLSSFGLSLLLLPAGQIPHIFDTGFGVNLLTVGGLESPTQKDYEKVLTIASFAFAGAFIYSLQLFLRSIVVFNLSALTFSRAFVHTVFVMLLAIVIWRVAPEGHFTFDIPWLTKTSTAQNVKGHTQATGETISEVALSSGIAKSSLANGEAAAQNTQTSGSIGKFWLFFAFVLGFLPDSSFARVFRTASLPFRRSYRKADKHARNVPLTIIDGIGFSIAFRLRQANIFDVQNLAAANPILIDIENPYNIFEAVDWVAQAQLCTAVGPERFLLLKKLNIRTIFDLESAVLDVRAPDGLKHMIGAVILANDVARQRMLKDFALKPLEVTYRDFEKNLAAWTNIPVIEHLVRVIIDDLHVHRLRQIWYDLEERLVPTRSQADKPVFTEPAINADAAKRSRRYEPALQPLSPRIPPTAEVAEHGAPQPSPQ